MASVCISSKNCGLLEIGDGTGAEGGQVGDGDGGCIEPVRALERGNQRELVYEPRDPEVAVEC